MVRYTLLEIECFMCNTTLEGKLAQKFGFAVVIVDLRAFLLL